MLKKWFKLDQCALEPEYVLQPISSHYKGYNKGVKSDWDAWNEDFAQMQAIFRNAAKSCEMSEDDRKQFFISITENEVRGGLLHEDNPNRPSQFYFDRSISNLDTNNPASRYFIDMNNGKVDTDATARLEQLKQYIKFKLPKEQKYRLVV